MELPHVAVAVEYTHAEDTLHGSGTSETREGEGRRDSLVEAHALDIVVKVGREDGLHILRVQREYTHVSEGSDGKGGAVELRGPFDKAIANVRFSLGGEGEEDVDVSGEGALYLRDELCT